MEATMILGKGEKQKLFGKIATPLARLDYQCPCGACDCPCACDCTGPGSCLACSWCSSEELASLDLSKITEL